MIKISNVVINSGATIREAMKVINDGVLGLCFVLQEKKIIGVLADGDVSRALLAGADLNSKVDAAMRSDFFSLPIHSSLETIQKNLIKYKYIPIVNSENEVVDVASAQRYHQIPLIQPALNGRELEYVTDCVQTGWISSQGKYVREFESKFASYVGSSNALAVSNGTVALHLALVALGVTKGDEVIVPNLTFAASVNAIIYTGATPVLVDVDLSTMAMSPDLVIKAITSKTKLILAVHLYGCPANLERLVEIAQSNNLLLIEDCAEALGTKYEDRYVGTFGNAATFSFFANKTMTTGEGGMIIFKDSNVHARANMLRDHGMSPNKKYWHQEVGFNYRLTNIQAAIGVAQLEQLDYFVERKKWIAGKYKEYLKDISILKLPLDGEDLANGQNSFWLYTIVLDSDLIGIRDEILENLKSNGVEARQVFIPMHKMPPYERFKRENQDFKNSEKLSDYGISLPSSVSMTEIEIFKVCNLIKSKINLILSKDKNVNQNSI